MFPDTASSFFLWKPSLVSGVLLKPEILSVKQAYKVELDRNITFMQTDYCQHCKDVSIHLTLLNPIQVKATEDHTHGQQELRSFASQQTRTQL
jgi:hypothetical protein